MAETAGWPQEHQGTVSTVAASLRKNILGELAFLRVVDAHADVLYDADVLRLAVARYTLLWLPLCTAPLRLPGNYLRPPLDIAFVWHCHVLNPTRCARL